jgi:hypothetical protein
MGRRQVGKDKGASGFDGLKRPLKGILCKIHGAADEQDGAGGGWPCVWRSTYAKARAVPRGYRRVWLSTGSALATIRAPSSSSSASVGLRPGPRMTCSAVSAMMARTSSTDRSRGRPRSRAWYTTIRYTSPTHGVPGGWIISYRASGRGRSLTSTCRAEPPWGMYQVRGASRISTPVPTSSPILHH